VRFLRVKVTGLCPAVLTERFAEPVLATAVLALALAPAGIGRPARTAVAFVAADGGDELAWYLTRRRGEWEPGRGCPRRHCAVSHRGHPRHLSGPMVPFGPAVGWAVMTN